MFGCTGQQTSRPARLATARSSENLFCISGPGFPVIVELIGVTWLPAERDCMSVMLPVDHNRLSHDCDYRNSDRRHRAYFDWTDFGTWKSIGTPRTTSASSIGGIRVLREARV
jgi:hypothetical protein